MEQSLMEKLTILADSAKYDVACTSSGASRAAKAGSMGSCYAPGCCHAFTADGRCVSLLKVLMTNCCAFDCSYCVNRRSNDAPRATFSPWELAELTIEFYRRNYIEGLFLSSAVLVSPDYTTERMLKTLRLLRNEYHFGGYIHAKAIPGTSPELLEQLGFLADRLSVNVELPSESSLKLLAPDKGRHSIFRPMKQIAVSGAASREELTLYRHAPKFAPAGQSTQMIVGASPETDYHILKLTESMYQKYSLKRVFYSAYIPVAEDTRLPALDTKPPLLREHRLYQADWLLRFYGFRAEELLDRYGLKRQRRYSPYMLSQGQQRRLAVLSVLAGGQELLLLDEPTYGQDARSVNAIMEHLREKVEQEGLTVIFITHDTELAAAWADKIYRLEDTALVEKSAEEVL